MSVFSKITLESLRKNRTRTVVTIIGVVLSVALITAVTTFIASLQNFLLQSAVERNGAWHVVFTDVDAAFVKTRAADNKVKSTAVTESVGYALLEGGENPGKPYLFVMGFSDEAFDTLPITLTSGRLPQNSSEILISDHVAYNGGVAFKIGDRITLSVGSRFIDGRELSQLVSYQSGEFEGSEQETFVPKTTKTYTVVGTCERPAWEEFYSPGYTVITKLDATASGLSGSSSAGSSANSSTASSAGAAANNSARYNVYVTLKSPGKVYEYAAKSGVGADKYTFNRDYLRFVGVSNNDSFNSILYSLATILIALILLGSIMLIYNSFAISVSERSRQFGILSSVGATGKQLRRSVLFEGLCIGAIGIPIGLIVGIAGIGITLFSIADKFTSLTGGRGLITLTVSAPALLIAVAVGIVTILISAFIPAQRAIRKSAIDSIRQTDDIKIPAKAVKTSKLTQRLFGLEGALALKNFKRNKKRYRSTVISLFLSVVLFISASSFGMYLKLGNEIAVQDFAYDLAFSHTVSVDKREDAELIRLYERMKNAEGVYESSYNNYANCYGAVMKSFLSQQYLDNFAYSATPDELVPQWLSIYFIDDASYLSYLKELGLSPAEYGIDKGKLVAVAQMSGFDESRRSYSFNMFKGRTVQMMVSTEDAPDNWYETTADHWTNWPGTAREITLTIVDTMPRALAQTQFNGCMAFAPYSSKFLLGIPDGSFNGISMTFMSHDPMKSAIEMEAMIKDAGLSAGYVLRNTAAMLEQNRNLILVINVFTYGFTILISLIAVANVFNTVSTSINLRRREFAMLRSVGMTDGAFNRMMNYECIFYGLKALLYGLPASLAVTYLIYRAV
ncbi:MAG: ABC transporter permease, partial [Coriobacteriia bacterium]|nr:ABC transporter permease [Coriobacteriia bacterium]